MLEWGTVVPLPPDALSASLPMALPQSWPSPPHSKASGLFQSGRAILTLRLSWARGPLKYLLPSQRPQSSPQLPQDSFHGESMTAARTTHVSPHPTPREAGVDPNLVHPPHLSKCLFPPSIGGENPAGPWP